MSSERVYKGHLECILSRSTNKTDDWCMNLKCKNQSHTKISDSLQVRSSYWLNIRHNKTETTIN